MKKLYKTFRVRSSKFDVICCNRLVFFLDDPQVVGNRGRIEFPKSIGIGLAVFSSSLVT